jgi:hypothetical protein
MRLRGGAFQHMMIRLSNNNIPLNELFRQLFRDIFVNLQQQAAVRHPALLIQYLVLMSTPYALRSISDFTLIIIQIARLLGISEQSGSSSFFCLLPIPNKSAC